MIDIKPCPFCGGAGTIKCYEDDTCTEEGEDLSLYFVCCGNSCAMYVETSNYSTPEEAVAIWNKRHCNTWRPMDDPLLEEYEIGRPILYVISNFKGNRAIQLDIWGRAECSSTRLYWMPIPEIPE